MLKIKSQLHLFVFLITLPLLFTLQACKKKEVVRAKAIPEAVKNYVYAYTSGVISKNDPVRVQFSGAAVATDRIGQEADSDILSFEPSVRGTAYWEDDHTVRFEPEKGWKSGTAYLVRVNLGKVFDNLPEDARRFEFDFLVKAQGISLEVESLEPATMDDLTGQVLTGRLYTNDEAGDEEVEKVLVVRQNGKDLSVSWEHISTTEHHFRVEGISRSNKPSEVVLQWDGNAIGVEVRGEKVVTIPALGYFSVVSAKVANGETQHIILHFSDPLDPEQNLRGLIAVRLDGKKQQKVTLQFTIDGNRVLVYPTPRLAGEQTVEVRPGIRNTEGARMEKPSVWQLQFEQQKPRVRLIGRGAILPNTGKGLVLPFEAVGLQAIEVEIFKIYNNNILQFLQTSGLGSSKRNSELRRVGRVIRRQMVPLQGLNPEGRPATWSRYALNLNQLFEADPNAIYQVRIGFRPEYAVYQCNNPKKNNNLRQVSQETYLDDNGEIRSFWGNYYGIEGYYEGFRWQHRENPCYPAYYNYNNFAAANVMASNLGITVKSSAPDADRRYSLFVAVADLRTTDEVAGATIEFYDFQQQLLGTATTDNNGMAQAVLARKPSFVIAKTETDRGYLKTADGNSLSLSRFNVAGTVKQKGLKGYLYGDRGVWRPGDSLFLHFILEDKEAGLPANFPISFELKDSRGQVQYKTVTTHNVENLYPLPVAVSTDAPTGNWTATVKAGGATFVKRLKIETVKPNRLKIDLAFPSYGKSLPNKLSIAQEPHRLAVQANWLHGAAAKNLKTVVELQMRKKNTVFEKFRGFEFDDPGRRVRSSTRVLFDGQTDQNGHADFSTSFYNKSARAPGMLQANFRARVFEKGGDFSFYNLSIPYSPYAAYAGISIPKNKYGVKRMEVGKTGKVEVVAVDETGQHLAGKKLSVGIYRVEWRWWWDRNSGGFSQFNSTNHYNALHKEEVTTGPDGKAQWEVKADTWGRYLVRVCDTESGHCAGDFFYAGYPWYGSNDMSMAQRREAAMMTFIASKDKYEVGDDIEIIVPAGDNGRVLITLETGSKVIRSFWEKANKGENKFRFEATPEMSPTVYAHVSLVQPHGQTQNDLPIRMYGVLPIKVEDPETVLKPIMQLPDELKPEQKFTITVKEDNDLPMAYTIAVVDEGLLGLTNFKTPDPHAALYAKEALGVKTWDVYDQVIGSYGGELERILSIGGDDEHKARAERKNANRFRPVVLHAGPFYLDGGKNTHTFKMPNYVGAVRVMLVAANEDAAYGKAEKTVKVKKPLMALATLPRVLGPNETLRLPVSIFAMDKKVQNVDVQLVETTGLVEITDRQTQQLHFSSPGEQMAFFNLRVGPAVGIAKFRVTASGAGERATQEMEIDVRNPNPYVTNVLDKNLRPGESWEQEIRPVGSPGTNEGYLEVSNLPPVNIGKHLQYLIRYPHGCVEQVTSSGFPQLYVDKIIELTPEQKSEVNRNVQATVNKLKNFQVASGGFSYWRGGSYDGWGTSYAGHFLLEAKNAGYTVPQGMIDRFVKFQTNEARRWTPVRPGGLPRYYQRWMELDQAYRLYTLALAGKPRQGAMNRLREMPGLHPAARWRLAAAYALSGKEEIARSLINALPVNVKPYEYWGPTYGSSLRDRAMILETQIIIGDMENAAANVRYIAESLGQGYWYSTQTTACSLLAIGKFLGENKATKEFKFQYRLPNGQTVNAGSLTPVMQVEVPVEQPGRSVSVTNTGEGVLFARLILSGQPLIGEETPAGKHLRMKVSYLNNDGKPIDPSGIVQGTDFIAEVTLTHPGERLINYDEMALTQVFPSGWEILNVRLFNFSAASYRGDTSRPEYQDVRDDRVFTYFDLHRGTSQTFRIRLNAAYPGRYYLPSVSCAAMYDESIYARSAGQWVEVVASN